MNENVTLALLTLSVGMCLCVASGLTGLLPERIHQGLGFRSIPEFKKSRKVQI